MAFTRRRWPLLSGVLLLHALCGCAIHAGSLGTTTQSSAFASEALWRRAAEVPVFKIVGEFCDEIIVEDPEYRDCRLAWATATMRLSGVPCGPRIRTADHHWDMDVLYVDGVEVAAAPPRRWRHEFDDVRFIENVSGLDAECLDYIPPIGTRVWAVGYPDDDDRDDVGELDTREKVIVEGVIVNDGGFHPDVVHIMLNGFVSGGMSGGPVLAELGGELVPFATMSNFGRCSIKPASWLDWFRPRDGLVLRAVVCRSQGIDGRGR